jgi:hypothetical protein
MLYLRFFSASHFQLGPAKQFPIFELILNKKIVQTRSRVSKKNRLAVTKENAEHVSAQKGLVMEQDS